MKFGHLDEISQIDFSMPPDHPVTAKVLDKKPVKHPNIYSGLAEWGNEGFPGKIYPKGTKAKDFLKLYGEQFKIVELNATGYRIPSVKTVEGWISAVGKDFIFCPKVSQPISQVKPLGKDPRALQQFYDAMRAFGDHLGVVFLQLHPTFSPNRYDDLVNFFDTWDHTFPLHVELRHADWFSNPEVLNNLFEAMRKRKIGTVITDTPGRRDVLHMGLTMPTAFIRFEGNELHPTDFTRLDAWTEHIKLWLDRGLETIYFFPHTTTKALTPEMSNHFLTQMNKLYRLDLKLAKIEEQGKLEL
ncbi:MAG TPA: DUF72 domain-containing protein [Candidatus Kapabacteria bacterium]|nr:DUF72 domain-containing protein [Candidatus Kapabacteria bacterium]